MKTTKVYICAVLLLFSSCFKPTSPERENMPPNTTLANVPKDGDTLFALATLHWDGEDYDGYVVKYQYRYITYHLIIGDSIIKDWEETDKTSLTIAFESSDEINMQKFQVRAVDNDGAVDPTPAEKIFYTRKAIPPSTKISFPLENQQFFVIDNTTDWWQGIPLTFKGKDQDGEIVEYAWSVDGGQWHWTKDTATYIKPNDFKPPLEGQHTIKVISRDNTNLIDPIGDSVKIKLIKPKFDREILIVDNTDERNFPSGIKANDDSTDNFYTRVFETTDQIDISKGETITRDVIGRYKLIVWHADDKPTIKPKEIVQYADTLKDYLSVGGNLLVSGWRIMRSFAWRQNFPAFFEPTSFVHEYLHVMSVDETSIIGDFTLASGIGLFNNIAVDSAKLATTFPYYGKLGEIDLFLQRAGFARPIYTYQNSKDSQFWYYRGRVIGIAYYGTIYNVAVLGFPLYFMSENDVKIFARNLLNSFKIK